MRRRSARMGLACLRGLGWTLLALAALLLALLTALHTAPGRRAILRLALPVLNTRLAGHVSVRGIDGDLWTRLVLIDARLDDAEGVEAIFAHRLEAQIDWRALLHGRFHVRDLRVDGARLTLRHLRDNRLNLVALGKRPEPARPRPPSPGKPPPLVEIDHFRLALDGAYHPPRGHEGHRIEWPRGRFDIEGAARFRGAAIDVRVQRLVSDARDPLQAHVELRGRLVVTPHGTPVGKPELTFEDVAVTVDSDGDEIARLHPALRARGRWSLHAEGGGPLAALQARAWLSAPAGSVTVDAAMARTFPGVRWQARVSGAGLDPAADWRGLPPGRVDFEVRGNGLRDAGELVLERLACDGAGIHVAAHGHSDFAGHGNGALVATVASLERLGDVGVHLDGVDELDGALALTAALGSDAHGTRLDGRARGERLWIRHGRFKAKARRLDAALLVRPGSPMTATLGARDVEVAGVGIGDRAQLFNVRIASTSLALRGQPRRFRAEVAATLADGLRARGAVRARVGAQGADLIVDALELARRKLVFDLPEPARLHLEGTAVAPRLRAEVAGARLEARARFGRETFVADAALDAPDLARLARLASVTVAGAARLRAHVTVGDVVAVDATADVRELRAPHAAAGRLHASLRSVDLVGDARLDGERLQLGPLVLSRLAVRARGSRERLHVTVDGRRADRAGATRLAVDAEGRWRTDGLRLVDADLLVRLLELDLPRQSWRLVAPAELSTRGGSWELRALRVRSGVGEVALDGRFGAGGVDLRLRIGDSDLEELGRVLGRPGLLPRARWSGRLRLAGTPAAPLIEATVEARADKSATWYGLAFNALSLSLFADGRHAVLHADARGRSDTRVVVDAEGTPRRQDWSLGRARHHVRARAAVGARPHLAAARPLPHRARRAAAQRRLHARLGARRDHRRRRGAARRRRRPRARRDALDASPRPPRSGRAAGAGPPRAAQDRLQDPGAPWRHARRAARRRLALGQGLGDRRGRPAGAGQLRDPRPLGRASPQGRGVDASGRLAPRHRRALRSTDDARRRAADLPRARSAAGALLQDPAAPADGHRRSARLLHAAGQRQRLDAQPAHPRRAARAVVGGSTICATTTPSSTSPTTGG